jgi:hypothetical protein
LQYIDTRLYCTYFLFFIKNKGQWTYANCPFISKELIRLTLAKQLAVL